MYLQDYPSLYELMQREAEAITEPRCANRCFLACYLEVERYLDHPLTVIGNLPLRQLLLGRMDKQPLRRLLHRKLPPLLQVSPQVNPTNCF